MFKAVILLTFALVAVQPTASASDRYVPATGWRQNEWAADFFERWYGNQLRAMNERPLSGIGHLDGRRRRFRLLVLPNYDPAYAYRVDLSREGIAELHFVRLDGAGGYAPGHIAHQTDRVLRPRESRRLAAALERAALRSRPRENWSDGGEENPDGTQTLTICLHATHFVFEVLDEHGWQFVSRESCHLEEELRQLVRVLYRLRPPRRAN